VVDMLVYKVVKLTSIL